MCSPLVAGVGLACGKPVAAVATMAGARQVVPLLGGLPVTKDDERPLSDVVQLPTGYEPLDGYVRPISLVPGLVRIAWSWLWPFGVIIGLGFGLQVLRAFVRGDEAFAWFLAVAGGAALLYILRRSYVGNSAGFSVVLCHVTVPPAVSAATGMRTRPWLDRRIPVVPLVVLPGERGLGLVDQKAAVQLRDAGVIVALDASRWGIVSRVTYRVGAKEYVGEAAGNLRQRWSRERLVEAQLHP